MNEDILKIPYVAVKKDWDLLQKFLSIKGNPRYMIVGNVLLNNRKDIFDLGNLVAVDGDLSLYSTAIESLGELKEVNGYMDLGNCENIKTLGKLKRVEGGLSLWSSSVESLGELEFVGKELLLKYTNITISELYKVKVLGKIYK
jgi:hypothetical protein